MSTRKELSPMARQVIGALMTALLTVVVLLAAEYGIPMAMPVAVDGVATLGVTHFSGMEVSGNETDMLVVNQTSTGDIVEFRDNGTVVWRLEDGGAVWSNATFDLNGNKLDLDVDADTSITADTDDQVDIEIGGADLFVLKDWGAAVVITDTTDYLFEIADTTNVMTAGTNSLVAFNIDLGIGNSTAGTNSVYGILIDGITQDAQNTETAMQIGNGWDRGLDLDGNSLYMDNDQDSYFSELADDSIGFTPGAASGSLEVRTGNLQVGDGSPGETHNGEDFYVEGISEFDGAAYFDGAVDVDASITGADDLEHIFFPTVASTAFTYTAAAGGTVTLFTITDGEIWIIHDIFVNVTTDFDCTGDDCTIHVGDAGDEDGLCDLDDGELQAADTEMTGVVAGWQCVASTDVVGAYLANAKSMIYAPSGGDGVISAVISETSGDTYAAGAATVYIVYTRIL